MQSNLTSNGSRAADPYTYYNALCVFEDNSGLPLRRHYDTNFADIGPSPFNFYGGVVDTQLVIRGITTVYNVRLRSAPMVHVSKLQYL
jgi:diamine oxidase